MEEIWKPIGIKNYAVSNLGNVKGSDGIRLLKPYKNRDGYLCIKITLSKLLIKTLKIHCLVMQTFIGDRPNEMEIDHINRIKDDNRLENLRYCSKSENQINSNRYRDDILETNKAERKYLIAKEYLQKYRLANREKHIEYMRNYNELNKK